MVREPGIYRVMFYVYRGIEALHCFLRRTQATQAQGSCVVDLIISLYLEKSNWKDFFQNCNLNEGFVFVSDRGGNAYEFSMRQSDEHGRGNEKTKDFATRC